MAQTNNEREALIADAREAGLTISACGDILMEYYGQWIVITDALIKFSQLQAARITNSTSQNEQQEPFGYFKAEPFGWTDCAETEEGAIPLYESPPKQAIPEGWISVKDRLPSLANKCEKYLIATKYGDVGEDTFNVYNWNTDKSFGSFNYSAITHWMPLPAAPTNTEVGKK